MLTLLATTAQTARLLPLATGGLYNFFNGAVSNQRSAFAPVSIRQRAFSIHDFGVASEE